MKRRRILIDGTTARGGGGFTYLVNLVPRLAQEAPDHRFLVLVRNERLARSLPEASNVEVRLLPETGLLGRLRFTHLDAPRIAREWDADLYFSASEGVPAVASCPRIASFRNPVVFSRLPLGWPLPQRMRLGILRAIARVSARFCDRIMFVSEDSARWIGDQLGLPVEQRAVIHHGIDSAGWSSYPSQPMHHRPYMLSVSSVYRFKNFARLIEAWGQLAERRPEVPDLVIVGDVQDPAYAERVREARRSLGARAKHVHLLGEVPYAEVRAYYASAEMFVLPSYLETFGHPLLEAFASGIPVVAADTPVFREIGGNAALYADPHSTGALAAAMEQVLEDPHLGADLVELGRERAQVFGWERTVQRLLSLFDEVIDARAVQPDVLPRLGQPMVAGVPASARAGQRPVLLDRIRLPRA